MNAARSIETDGVSIYWDAWMTVIDRSIVSRTCEHSEKKSFVFVEKCTTRSMDLGGHIMYPNSC